MEKQPRELFFSPPPPPLQKKKTGRPKKGPQSPKPPPKIRRNSNFQQAPLKFRQWKSWAPQISQK